LTTLDSEIPKALSVPAVAPSPQMDPLPAPATVRRVIPQPIAVAQVALKNGQVVKYPAAVVTGSAITKIATRQVSSVRNRCARTMREALGWGLGDAHQWVQLERYGFNRRKLGEGAQPGDIIVWPFTFGSRRSQHIGVAVGTERGTRLLSNLSGSIEVSALAPGYRAYYKPVLAPPAVVVSHKSPDYLPSSAPSPTLILTSLPTPLPRTASQTQPIPPRI
jgi:hypothetical protein